MASMQSSQDTGRSRDRRPPTFGSLQPRVRSESRRLSEGPVQTVPHKRGCCPGPLHEGGPVRVFSRTANAWLDGEVAGFVDEDLIDVLYAAEDECGTLWRFRKTLHLQSEHLVIPEEHDDMQDLSGSEQSSGMSDEIKEISRSHIELSGSDDELMEERDPEYIKVNEICKHLPLALVHCQFRPPYLSDQQEKAHVKFDGYVADMLPVEQRLPNFRKYVEASKPYHMKRDDMRRLVWQYTSGKKQPHYLGINMALMFDDCNFLKEWGKFIRQLRYSIRQMGNSRPQRLGHRYPNGTRWLWRGVEMSNREVKAMKKSRIFYMPGFVSTTQNPKKAFTGNTLLAFDVTQADGDSMLEITGGLSIYDEDEVLLNCYLRYELIGIYEKGMREGKPRKLYLKVVPREKVYR